MYHKKFNQRRGSSPHRKRGNFSRAKKFVRGNSKGQYIDPLKFINKAITVAEEVKFVPKHKFEDFDVADALKKNVINKGYVEPTPIQDSAIPHVLSGKDVVGIANTGTGKTAAFLIPLINKVILNSKEEVLIIVPTRELALQIDEELKGFTKNMRIFSVVVVGGAPVAPQIKALRYKNDFVIGTPGRLKDLIERGNIKLEHYSTLVLDEADRMLDMGFIDDMRFVVRGMPKNRHTLFFSATLNKEIETLVNEFLKDPVHISVKTGDTSKNVDQDVIRMERGGDKFSVLHNLLNQEEFKKVLVFGRTKHGVEKLFRSLRDKAFKAESIHGDKSHSQRQIALNRFKQNHSQILVATDVAARGLDISDVSHVINYDLPATYEDYVHRIGRTGRGAKRGKALTFID